MGMTNSTTNSDLKSSSIINNNTLQLSLKNKDIIYFGWQEICRCSYTNWLHGISQFFGFIPHKFVCNCELHSVCAPGFCSESLSCKLYHNTYRLSSKKFSSSSSITKSKKLHEHFEYNHIPAMISSLQNYSIHGIVNGCLNHGDTIMLLIYSIVLEKTKFIIVDLKLNRYICSFGDNYNGLIDVKKVHGAWSMDRTQVIIRYPILNGTTFALDFYKIIKKEAQLYRRILSIDHDTQFQFCPNYWSSRLAFYMNSITTQITLINYNIKSSISNKIQTETIKLHQPFIGSYLSLINIHSWSTYKNQNIQLENDFRLLSLQYTPDSVYIILIFVDKLCHCEQILPRSYFNIYYSNNLQCIHRINTQLMLNICPWHMCRNYLTPIFSLSSSRMAFCTTKNNNGKELQISIIVLPNELNLKSICRRWIINYLNEFKGKIEDINSEIPYRLSQYIQYRPEYQ